MLKQMDIGDSPAEAAFRAEARAWLAAHAELRTAEAADAYADLAAHAAACRRWQRTLFDGGWAGITWPKEHGGRGGSAIQAAIFNEEQSRYDVSTGIFAVGIGMVGPTLIAHGSDEQRAAYLPPMLRGEQVWCQLFSEPGAGSDLAGLGTRAVRDGDEWVVSGQKVWTSMAQFADLGILLARTDPDAPKHKGITCFIVDMRSAGIEVRPLRQITGVAHFNETFLDNVRIPAANVIGAVGGGWNVARTTLTSERAFIGGGNSAWTIDGLLQMAAKRGAASDPVVRQDLMRAYCRQATLNFLGYRLRTAMSQGRVPGREVLIMKLAYAGHWSATAAAAVGMLGADGMLLETDPHGDGLWPRHLLAQYSVRLGGGTDEVQRNIIAEVGLGLPRDPHNDSTVPWKNLPRS